MKYDDDGDGRNELIGSHQLDEDALQDAVERSAEEVRKRDADQPDYIGNRCVFIFCQYLKGVVEPKQARVDILKPWLREWYERCKDILQDECGEPLSFTEAWQQFIDIWEKDKVKYPKAERLKAAEARARKYGKPRPEVAHYDDPRVQHLAHTCYELQESNASGELYLSQKDAARIMGRSERIGYTALQMLCHDRVLERLERGHTGFASRYRYTRQANGEKPRTAEGSARPLRRRRKYELRERLDRAIQRGDLEISDENKG